MKIINQPNLSGLARASHGTYQGDDTVQRAIPHNLGVVPQCVFIDRSGGVYYHHIIRDIGIIHCWNASVNSYKTGKALDTTNFYVGNADDYDKSANKNAQRYDWFAVG